MAAPPPGAGPGIEPGVGPPLESEVPLGAELAARRDDAVAAVDAGERDFGRLVEAARSVSTDDEHDPEGVGLAVERALVVAALERARERVARLDDALARLADGTYGRCDTCGGQIGADRLRALPATTTCIGCASAMGRRSLGG
ncbi:TraR/DksA family transcriptional regulator [Pengzhenrongella sicca]|uniref:TraR/DksA family transcriptional regulator n=1 Tax=Pengzhenrongella sicca TaxID=2819238 RepID=A0A8A4ZBH0_9MICO|nr:TraR/DksA C4-type zinc finger protein [Pengzhenrongella sicca]QTE27936.1 TraR/DksA family transcriptional regulator [Pengzhenrongella sicca]